MGLLNRFLSPPLLPVILTTPDGFVDLAVPIVAGPTDGKQQAAYRARGKLESRLVGLGVTFGQEWQEGPAGTGENVVYWGTCNLQRIGSESDNLVTVLAMKYGHNSFAERAMLQEIRAKVVCMEGNPMSKRPQELRTKVFLHEERPSRYAEFYINVSSTRAVLEVREKAHGYRLAILRALTEA